MMPDVQLAIPTAFDHHDRLLLDIECEMLRRLHQPFARINNGPPIKVKVKGVIVRAEDARRITNDHLQGPAIQEYVDQINIRIRLAAEQGRSEIDLFQGLKPYPSPHLQGTIKDHFRALGYQVTDHSDPDPGHPCSRPYTLLKW